mmetsp:Transcript_410/g.884  ORF Transcript_410/g.884 Transcript_410/m.884 type:complete len:107 (+) Transcript_410:84-404(+)
MTALSRFGRRQKSKSVDALTDPTAAMSSSSFCLAKEEGRDAFDFVARHAGHSRVGSHRSNKLLERASRRWKTLQGRRNSGGLAQRDRGADQLALPPRSRRREDQVV